MSRKWYFLLTMSYRSERFDPGDLTGIERAWELIDLFDANQVPVVNEVMAGMRYRRQLHEETRANVGEVDYLLQVTLEPELRTDGFRLQPRSYLDKARHLLSLVNMPGDIQIDEGGLNGWDVKTTKEYPLGTGKTETEILSVYSPWLQTRWEEAGKQCMFFLGILPPRPKPYMEDWMSDWNERALRAGKIVFESTPDDLSTW